MQQASAWGQFWFDLSSLGVHGGAIFTPLQRHIKHPAHRGKFYSTWHRMTPKGPVYYAVNGDTMVDMLLDGLRQTGTVGIRMKLTLIAMLTEAITVGLESRL